LRVEGGGWRVEGSELRVSGFGLTGRNLDRLLIPEDREEVEESEHAVDLRRARI